MQRETASAIEEACWIKSYTASYHASSSMVVGQRTFVRRRWISAGPVGRLLPRSVNNGSTIGVSGAWGLQTVSAAVHPPPPTNYRQTATQTSHRHCRHHKHRSMWSDGQACMQANVHALTRQIGGQRRIHPPAVMGPFLGPRASNLSYIMVFRICIIASFWSFEEGWHKV